MTGADDAQSSGRPGGVLPVITTRDGQGCVGAALPDVSLPLPGPVGGSSSVRGVERDALVLPPPIHRSAPHDETNTKGAERNG